MSNRKDVIDFLTSHGAVMIPLSGKKPLTEGWQNTKESHPDALDPETDDNIGVVLGDASKGMVDVDIDRPSALPLARFFLPKTEMIFGRESKPRSHWIYRCGEAGSCRKWQDEKGVIVELRANGGQTMFPSSIHPDTGERVVRRHLTTHQRAAIAAEFVTTKHGDNQHSRGPENFPVLTQAEAAGKFHVNERYVRDALAVKRASEGLHGLVKGGRLPASDAAGVVRALPTRIDAFVELVEGGKQPDDALREIVTAAEKPSKADKLTPKKKETGADPRLSQKMLADPDEEYATLIRFKFNREEILVLIPLIEAARPKQVVGKLREKLAADAKAAEVAPSSEKPAGKEKKAKATTPKQAADESVPATTRSCFLQQHLQRTLDEFLGGGQPEAKDEEIVRKLREKCEALTDDEAQQYFEAHYLSVEDAERNSIPKEKKTGWKRQELMRQDVADGLFEQMMNDLRIDASKAPWKLRR